MLYFYEDIVFFFLLAYNSKQNNEIIETDWIIYCDIIKNKNIEILLDFQILVFKLVEAYFIIYSVLSAIDCNVINIICDVLGDL